MVMWWRIDNDYGGGDDKEGSENIGLEMKCLEVSLDDDDRQR